MESKMILAQIKIINEAMIFEPKYADRYIQYLERLSKDTSINNIHNANIAKDTIEKINVPKDYNKHLKEWIREKRTLQNN